MRESDWEALADVQFTLYNRVANQLNEALSGLALSDMPEASDHTPGYWKERATNKILNVLNMFTAWTWLVRYKMGESIPERAIRPFSTNALLGWVGAQLQLVPPPVTVSNPLLRANQETLQEALLLLHSVAYTQGSAVRLVFEAAATGTWFRVRFVRHKPVPVTLDGLIASFGDHWRAQDTLFELTTARDFVRLNGCQLAFNTGPDYGEFAFFVPAAAGRRQTGTAPQVQAVGTLAPSHSTPVIKEPEPAPVPPAPPLLAVLRPLPPQIASTRPAVRTASEGRAPRGEPEEVKPAVQAQDAPKAGESSSAPFETRRARSSIKPPETAAPAASVIRSVKLPEPKMPEHLRTPPAATSNVALTRETQTLAPVRPEDAPAAGNSDAAVNPPQQGAPSSAREESSR